MSHLFSSEKEMADNILRLLNDLEGFIPLGLLVRSLTWISKCYQLNIGRTLLLHLHQWHLDCSPAKQLGGSFPSLFTWEQGRRALSCNKLHLLGKTECHVPWLLQSFHHERICFPRRALEDLLHPVTMFFLKQGDPSSSVSCERKEAVMKVQRSHMLCKMWKVLCWTPCFPLDSAPGSAKLEVKGFWCSESRESSWMWAVPLPSPVHFCTFSFLPVSRSGSRTSEQSGGNMKSLATLVAFSIWQKLISFLLPSQIPQWVSEAKYKATKGGRDI